MEKKSSLKFIELLKSGGIQAFTEQTSAKFTELFTIKCGTFRINYTAPQKKNEKLLPATRPQPPYMFSG